MKKSSQTGDRGKDRSISGLNELVNMAWQPLLAEVGDTLKAKLTAMLEALQVCARAWCMCVCLCVSVCVCECVCVHVCVCVCVCVCV